MALLLLGCARVNPQQKPIDNKAKEFNRQSQSRIVDVRNEPYLGVKVKTLLSATMPSLQKKVMLHQKGSLETIANTISELANITVQVALDQDETKKNILSQLQTEPSRTPTPQNNNQGNPETSDKPTSEESKKPNINIELESLLQNGKRAGFNHGNSFQPPYANKLLHVNYEGTLRGLLDHIAILSGYGWDYNEQNKTVTFSHMLVRTFTILGAPGKVSYENKLTNKSKENSGSISSSKVNSTVTTSDTGNQTSQTSSTRLIYDIWADTERGVKSLLTAKGTVTCNQAAGTITVRDTPESIRRVGQYVDDLNSRLSRQVALTVRVWSLNLSDNTELGFSINAIFENSDISISAGDVTDITGINTATATIVSGKLKNSTGVLKALREWGNASQITSAGGLVMSNQPVPVLAIKRIAYLASVGKSTTDYSQTTEVTPGEVTTGFAMTVIPHILEQRKVILQYNVNISTLDSMKDYTTSDVTVELPQVSTQALSQRSTMKMGQTLVLCGFEKESKDLSTSLGFTSSSRVNDSGRTLLIITISVESADA
jgi:type IVB pilus formation R64 PilN family outer membrane protein